MITAKHSLKETMKITITTTTHLSLNIPNINRMARKEILLQMVIKLMVTKEIIIKMVIIKTDMVNYSITEIINTIQSINKTIIKITTVTVYN